MGTGWAVVLLSMGERVLEKVAIMWGQGQRTAWAITLSSVRSPPLVMGFSLSHPSSESRVMIELVRPRQRRKNTRDQSWRHLQAGVRRGVEQR